MKKRIKVFSLTKKDFDFETFRGSGAGGQNRNKRDTAVRIRHRESGIACECQEYRTQGQNKKIAFKKLSQHPEFLKWIKFQVARIEGELDARVERAMNPKNILVETF